MASDYSKLMFDQDDDIEALIIPIHVKPQKRIVEGELQFADIPIKLGQRNHIHNINQLRHLLSIGYKTVFSFPIELERQLYAYVVLYRPK